MEGRSSVFPSQMSFQPLEWMATAPKDTHERKGPLLLYTGLTPVDIQTQKVAELQFRERNFYSQTSNRLRPRLLLLLGPQTVSQDVSMRAVVVMAVLGNLRVKTDTGDLDDLESDTGNISLGLALTTETGEEDLVVLVDKVQTTVIGN